MNKKLIILLLLLPVMAFGKNVINSGHQTPVKFIKYYERAHAFFSLSEDGTLVIKDGADDKISQRFFLTGNTISSLELSDTEDILAVVETDSASKYTISVWNWKIERKLYSINLEEFPMFIGFTGGGNYLYVSSISRTPVKVFNAKTGAATTYLNGNNNYIDFIYVGSSERTAYLYSGASGTLDIRYLQNSRLIRSVKTERSLTNLMLTPDKKYIIAKKNSNIYLIGRNDGKIYDQLTVEDLNSYKLNATTGELIAYTNNRYKKAFKRLQIVGGRFFESSNQDIIIKNNVSVFAGAGNQIIYSEFNNVIDSYNIWNKEHTLFLDNDIVNINSISVLNDTAAIISANKIMVFTSPFFSDRLKNSKRLTDFTIKSYDSPVINSTGSKAIEEDLLLWNENLVLVNLESGETIFNVKFSSQVVDVKYEDGRILALDKNGLVQIIDLATNNVVFNFRSPGFTSVNFNGENEIIGGIDNSHGGSLLRVDLKTKETIPLETSLDVVFNIIPSSKSYIVYLSGVKITNGTSHNYVVEYNLLTNNEKTILNSDSEDLDPSFESDLNNIIYTNLGTKSIISINTSTRRIRPFQTTTNQTKSITFNNGAVYTVNENKSLSIWDPRTARKIIDFYMFKDNQWVAITENSTTAFGSEDSEKYISNK